MTWSRESSKGGNKTQQVGWLVALHSAEMYIFSLKNQIKTKKIPCFISCFVKHKQGAPVGSIHVKGKCTGNWGKTGMHVRNSKVTRLWILLLRWVMEFRETGLRKPIYLPKYFFTTYISMFEIWANQLQSLDPTQTLVSTFCLHNFNIWTLCPNVEHVLKKC